MTPENFSFLLLLKFLGAVIGAGVAQIFVLPQTKGEFYRRLFVSLCVGLGFSFVPHLWLGFPTDIEGTVAAAFLMAAVAWWLAGSVKRIAETLGVKSKD